MKRLRILLIFMVILLCFLLSACQDGKQLIYSNYNYFGTTLKAVVYTDNDSFNSFTKQADTILESINKTLSEDIEGSDISRFNNAIDGEKIEVAEICYNLVEKTKDIYKLTLGAYNPSVYHLVDLWGFSPRFSIKKDILKPYDRAFDESGFLPLPDQKYIDAFSMLADFDKVTNFIIDGKFYLMKEDSKVSLDGVDYYTKIDLGGLMKGYAVDALTEIAKELNITKGYISYGTSSIAILENKKGDSWDLTLTNPRYIEGRETFVKLPIKNKQISSSGDYERYYEKDGKRYSHIIDATSGKPIDNGVLASSVICDSAAYADMLSTAFCAMGKDKAVELIASDYFVVNDIQVILTYMQNDKMEIFSSRINNLTLQDDRYEVKKI
jgi:thiamine biosynthesis lipoprotein